MKSSCRDDSRRYRIEACSKPGSEVKLAQNYQIQVLTLKAFRISPIGSK